MPFLATVSADTWVTTEPIQRLLLDIATGRLDALSGCHLHAVHDDLDDLLAHAAEIAATGSRTLGPLPYRTDDPAARPQQPAKESR